MRQSICTCASGRVTLRVCLGWPDNYVQHDEDIWGTPKINFLLQKDKNVVNSHVDFFFLLKHTHTRGKQEWSWQEQKGPCLQNFLPFQKWLLILVKIFCISKKIQLVKWKLSKENVTVCGLKYIPSMWRVNWNRSAPDKTRFPVVTLSSWI